MKRNYGIDLLRMVLMMMVLLLHILWHGGILGAADVLSLNYNVAWLLETMSYCAVNCYIIITGYVHMNAKYKISSYVLLWLQVVMYSVGIAACAWIIKPETFSVQKLLYFLSPVSHNLFWFFSAYTGLYVLIPFLNAAVQYLRPHQAKGYLVIAIFTLSLLSTFTYKDPFVLNNGYSVLWFIVLYFIGACIKKFEWDKKFSAKGAFVVYFTCVVVSWGLKMVQDWYITMAGEIVQQSSPLISYISPTILIAAIALFIAFKNFKLNAKACKLIGWLSPTAFGVYLIHTHECVGVHIITDKYAFFAEYGVFAMVGGIIGIAITIFTLCLLIDLIRHRIFTTLKIKWRLERIEQKIVSFLKNENKNVQS